jgi:Protein of unknown function (DUF3224)
VAGNPETPARQAIQKGISMSLHAKGAFEVKVTPQAADSKDAQSANLGRMSISKSFHGDLEGVSHGEMLSAITQVTGSAGYVAMERVEGILQGRKGTFVLQHNGTMNRGTPLLTISIVPDSGTGELAGVSGTMTIEMAGSQHSYELIYSLPDKL